MYGYGGMWKINFFFWIFTDSIFFFFKSSYSTQFLRLCLIHPNNPSSPMFFFFCNVSSFCSISVNNLMNKEYTLYNNLIYLLTLKIHITTTQFSIFSFLSPDTVYSPHRFLTFSRVYKENPYWNISFYFPSLIFIWESGGKWWERMKEAKRGIRKV